MSIDLKGALYHEIYSLTHKRTTPSQVRAWRNP